MNNYADAFKALRRAYRLTQAEFAELLRISKPALQKLEAGAYPPSEKINAGLAELFRSEKFRGEFWPRIDGGDLHILRKAFGNLLDLADVGGAGVLPPVPSAMPDNLAVELLEMMRSQQDKILDLSTNLSESNKNLSESSKNWSETGKNLSESTKDLAKSTKNLSESNKSLADSIKSLAGVRPPR